MEDFFEKLYFLSLAIILEVFGTMLLPVSQNFTKIFQRLPW